MAIVTQTDSPKSVRNRFVIEVLVGFVCCHVAFWGFSVGVGAIVIGLSQISSFVSCYFHLVDSGVYVSHASRLVA